MAALEAAYYRGVEYVSYAGDQIKYVSRDELRRAIDELRAELSLPCGVSPPASVS
ncbi:phage head-tail joining protein [Paracoccus sp. MKU1]|uniref:phage head-tail joining protein n=1 Tax=Paracoccus sp. MKU1 TaxID=1745182 RepID=UPI000A4906F6